MHVRVGQLIYGMPAGGALEPYSQNPFDILREALRGPEFKELLQAHISEAAKETIPLTLERNLVADVEPGAADRIGERDAPGRKV